MPTNFPLSRRTCLKGLGAALSLPLLDCMGWAESGGKTYKPPVRLGFMYMPHGVIIDQFWPQSPETFLTSPPPALVRLSNQFQQLHGLHFAVCRGSNTSQPWRSACVAMRVPVANCSGVCRQP